MEHSLEQRVAELEKKVAELEGRVPEQQVNKNKIETIIDELMAILVKHKLSVSEVNTVIRRLMRKVTSSSRCI